ncbi:MAG: hypothetical protein EBR82_88440 [Caulobacteraceae bacterium]|nr:hypothetical protein [Caulobacteraceae bacterium]
MSVRPTFTSGDVFTAANANILATSIVALNAQAGTAYTAALTDVGKLVNFTSSSAVVFTIPASGTVAFAVGDQINVYQSGSGQVTITPAATVTIRSAGSKLKTNAQYAVATCIKIATDEWIALGNLSA